MGGFSKDWGWMKLVEMGSVYVILTLVELMAVCRI